MSVLWSFLLFSPPGALSHMYHSTQCTSADLGSVFTLAYDYMDKSDPRSVLYSETLDVEV